MNEYARSSLAWDFDRPAAGRSRKVGTDSMGMHLLVEMAVGDSTGFDVMSLDELEELKKEEAGIVRRLPGLRRELALETKYRDAAKGLSKMDGVDKRSRGSSRMSQNEYAASVAKCDNLSSDLYRLERRLSELREQRLRHTAGVLQLEYEQRSGQTELSKVNGYEESDDWDSGFNLARFAPGGLADTEDGIMDLPGGHDPHVDATLRDLWTMLNSHDELLETQDMSNGIADEEFSIEAFSEKVQTLCSRAAGLSYELESEREARHVTEEAQKSNRAQLLEQLQATKERHQQSEADLDQARQEADAAHQAHSQIQADHENLEAEVVRLQTEMTMAKAELDSAYGSKAQRAAEMENEAKAQNERLQHELRELVTEHEALTQQGIESEKEREKLEGQIDQMRERMEGLEVKLSEERVHKMARGSGSSTTASTPASGAGGSSRGSEDPTSLRVMRSEFKKMMRDARAEHFRGLKVSMIIFWLL